MYVRGALSNRTVPWLGAVCSGECTSAGFLPRSLALSLWLLMCVWEREREREREVRSREVRAREVESMSGSAGMHVQSDTRMSACAHVQFGTAAQLAES